MASGVGRLVSAVVSRLATRYVSLFAIHFLLRLLNEKNRTLVVGRLRKFAVPPGIRRVP